MAASLPEVLERVVDGAFFRFALVRFEIGLQLLFGSVGVYQ
jgi:hypothetical protein